VYGYYSDILVLSIHGEKRTASFLPKHRAGQDQ
jgi:hypothetical protein